MGRRSYGTGRLYSRVDAAGKESWVRLLVLARTADQTEDRPKAPARFQ